MAAWSRQRRPEGESEGIVFCLAFRQGEAEDRTGIVLLLAAAWYARSNLEATSGSDQSTPIQATLHRLLEPKAHALTAAFLAGVVLTLTNVQALTMYLVALWQIADARLGWTTTTILVAVFVAVTLLWVEILIAIYVADPRSARRLVGTARQWISEHGRTLTCGLVLLIGIYLVVRGISGLVG